MYPEAHGNANVRGVTGGGEGLARSLGSGGVQAKISESDWLIAMRAAPAEPHTSSEEVTVWAALLTYEADVTGRTLVNGQRHSRAS